MAEISKERILIDAMQITGGKPTAERAEELAGMLTRLIEALDKAAADVPFEAEPADMQAALDQLAGY